MEPQQIWQAVLGEIEILIPKTQFSTWFKETKLKSINGETATILAANSYCRDWLKSKYSNEIISAFTKIEPNIKEVIFETKNVNLFDQLPVEITPALDEKPSGSRPKANNLNNEYTFDTLVVGNNNSLAYAVAKEVADKPGKSHNPLFQEHMLLHDSHHKKPYLLY